MDPPGASGMDTNVPLGTSHYLWPIPPPAINNDRRVPYKLVFRGGKIKLRNNVVAFLKGELVCWRSTCDNLRQLGAKNRYFGDFSRGILILSIFDETYETFTSVPATDPCL